MASASVSAVRCLGGIGGGPAFAFEIISPQNLAFVSSRRQMRASGLLLITKERNNDSRQSITKTDRRGTGT